ncbi:Phosphotransferase enzyme family protein [Limihaloglobus sulfuriphilus]|uniref:Phosphotransferase enzyme family protein n=1 Tax=Limihaloglobus sulfuriphilus TaxID=1851148 RepID=A0A1Q2MEV8_9BACT|nr:aminoglycoside phosphotransferase family protein [Limihaloglobus sulfuriphilus]AQQ70827.1 Phosphotransferase enzyme family protein [Limihaloglobus sulfuriphilus]
MQLEQIVKQFQIYGDFVEGHPYGSGHINDTYKVSVNLSGTKVNYLLQRINNAIFPNVEKLMENITRVTEHCAEKFCQMGYSDISRRCLTVVKTHSGGSFYFDHEGGYWRVYLFVEDATGFDVPETNEQIYQAGAAFARFQSMLVDIPGEPLYEIIPGFHDGKKRLAAFENALEADRFNRAANASAEIKYQLDNAWMFDVLPDLVKKGAVPIRVTHNDTKINNVLIDDKTAEGVCVIDLDTVMPGLSLYDFGDLVRTSTSPTQEDEKNIDIVGLRLDRFESLLNGFMSVGRDYLNKTEIEYLVFAGKLITMTIGMRFLTDYLSGDTYFKVHREGHNLDRCRTQYKLVQSITDQQDELESLVADTVR